MKCIMTIIDYRESIIYIILKIGKFDPLFNTIIDAKRDY